MLQNVRNERECYTMHPLCLSSHHSRNFICGQYWGRFALSFASKYRERIVKRFYFKLQNYFNDKEYYNDNEQSWVAFDKATLYSGYLRYRDIDGPKLVTEPELNRHDLCNLIPCTVSPIECEE